MIVAATAIATRNHHDDPHNYHDHHNHTNHLQMRARALMPPTVQGHNNNCDICSGSSSKDGLRRRRRGGDPPAISCPPEHALMTRCQLNNEVSDRSSRSAME